MKDFSEIIKSQWLKAAAVLIAAWLIGFAAMTLVYKLDTAPMMRHVKSSINTFEQEGNYPRWSKGLVFTANDNFTDALMLSTAICPKQDKSFIMAMKNYNYAGAKDNSGPAGALVHMVNGRMDRVNGGSYERYWHGYNVVLKPLLVLTNFSEIRALNYIVQLALLVLLFVKTHERLGWRGTVALGLGVIVLNPVSAATSLQYAPIFYTTVIASIVAVTKESVSDRLPLGLFLVAGICASFFDLLTYPVASLGLPLCLSLCCRNVNAVRSLRENLVFFVAAAVAWCFGYFGMWFGKWVLATLVTDQNVFLNAYRAARFRLDGEVPWLKGQELTAFQVIKAQLGVLKFRAMIVTLAAFVIFLLAGALKNRRKLAETVTMEKSLLCGLGLTALLPMIWAAVMKNHSFIHTFFTHKGYAVTFAALAMLALLICYPRRRELGEKPRH